MRAALAVMKATYEEDENSAMEMEKEKEAKEKRIEEAQAKEESLSFLQAQHSRRSRRSSEGMWGCIIFF